MAEVLVLTGIFLGAAGFGILLSAALDGLRLRRRRPMEAATVARAARACREAERRAQSTGTLADYVRWQQGRHLLAASVALRQNRFDLAETLRDDAAFLGRTAEEAEASDRQPTFITPN